MPNMLTCSFELSEYNFSHALTLTFELISSSSLYKGWLALNVPQWLICHKTKPRGVIVKALDFGIVVSEFELQSGFLFTFGQITLGKI